MYLYVSGVFNFELLATRMKVLVRVGFGGPRQAFSTYPLSSALLEMRSPPFELPPPRNFSELELMCSMVSAVFKGSRERSKKVKKDEVLYVSQAMCRRNSALFLLEEG